MPRDMTACGRYPPQPWYKPISFYSAVRLGDPEQLAKIMARDPYFVTQDNGAGAPVHFATTYRQLDMVSFAAPHFWFRQAGRALLTSAYGRSCTTFSTTARRSISATTAGSRRCTARDIWRTMTATWRSMSTCWWTTVLALFVSLLNSVQR